jgi:malate dehydrogenase (oxaloacetate-decarboxylating)(NADP+)
VNPENDPRYRDYWGTYHSRSWSAAASPRPRACDHAHQHHRHRRRDGHRDEADSLICGTFGQYLWHLNYVRQVLGTRKLHPVGALSLMILEDGPLFIADTHVHAQPSARADRRNRHRRRAPCARFGMEPKIALCSGNRSSAISTATAAADARGA